MSTTLDPRNDPVVAERPRPGPPRAYEFPPVAMDHLPNGLTVLIADLPGRPLVSASVVIRGGASHEPAAEGGSTVLAARALSEGTESYDAIELVEAAERLGASIHADAGWDALSVSVDVPADRLEKALQLVAEVLLRPTFPAAEVERLRDERLNDLLQAQADPRRRAEQAFASTIYATASPYHRPSGGTRETVERLTRDHLRRAYQRALDPHRAALIVAGDLGGQHLLPLAERLFGGWSVPSDGRATDTPTVVDTAASQRRVVHVVHRPGSVQTEIRIGHRGLSRRIPDFHAVSVMSAILGGLFNSRLNMKLREEKGYTYGASAGFDMRRGAGPFAARAAVNTEVTVQAVLDMLGELDGIRASEVKASELAAARDFLIGVFPLRFETAGAVVGALSGLAVHELEVDELIGYRERIEAVDAASVADAARAHIHLDETAVVLVGDIDAFGEALEAAALGPIVIERDPVPEPPLPGELEETPRPIDEEDQEGPTAGAEEPQLPGVPDDPSEAG
ncbi:MAG TPA: pitrilysin family protein [Candidatus Limnocylindrales bacterium]|nr:pitrilysin family protein [Candidatus Limnocylindrales bacterium]